MTSLSSSGAVERRSLWSATDLLAHQFPEPRWAVPGVIPEGLTLLAGPPKVGKSWLSLNLGVAVATGSPALDSVEVNAGHVLYLALEDTPRRLQRRLHTVIVDQTVPEQLAFAVDWPPMPTGGADLLHKTLTSTPDTRLVVVDVLAKVRGNTDTRGSMYDADYAAMGHLKAVADAHNTAVVVVHHVRKSGSEDFLETISGTNGLAGAADTIAVLRRSATPPMPSCTSPVVTSKKPNTHSVSTPPPAHGPFSDGPLPTTRLEILAGPSLLCSARPAGCVRPRSLLD